MRFFFCSEIVFQIRSLFNSYLACKMHKTEAEIGPSSEIFSEWDFPLWFIPFVLPWSRCTSDPGVWVSCKFLWRDSPVSLSEAQPGTQLGLAGAWLSFASCQRVGARCQVAWDRAAASADLLRGWAAGTQDGRWQSHRQLPCGLPLLPCQANLSARRSLF